MSDVNRNKLRALATGCRDEVIRSHGWEGTIEEADLIARDRRLLMELSPEVVIQLLDDYDALLAERDQLRAELIKANDRYQRDVYGLNNEGDPIGGEPPGGYANDNARLRAELAAIRGQPSAALIEAARELISAARSVNRSKAHEVGAFIDGEPCYWQRKEWVDWLVENGEKARQALDALPPQQPDAVSVPREQSDVPLYAAINRACSELPDGWYIELNAERDGAWVALLNAELEVVDFPTNNERLDYTVSDAVEFALLSTRQAEEGE